MSELSVCVCVCVCECEYLREEEKRDQGGRGVCRRRVCFLPGDREEDLQDGNSRLVLKV